MARIDIYKNGELVLQMLLDRPRLQIGRGTGCDIALSEPSISRVHAELNFLEYYWELKNLGRNGTRLNASQLDAPARLDFGDRIYIGPYALVFQTDNAPLISRSQSTENPTEEWHMVTAEAAPPEENTNHR